MIYDIFDIWYMIYDIYHIWYMIYHIYHIWYMIYMIYMIYMWYNIYDIWYMIYIWKSESVSHSVVSNSLWSHGLQPTRLLCPRGFSRQDNWGGLPFPSPGDLPDSGIEPRSPKLQADSLSSEPPGKSQIHTYGYLYKLGRMFLKTLESVF